MVSTKRIAAALATAGLLCLPAMATAAGEPDADPAMVEAGEVRTLEAEQPEEFEELDDVIGRAALLAPVTVGGNATNLLVPIEDANREAVVGALATLGTVTPADADAVLVALEAVALGENVVPDVIADLPYSGVQEVVVASDNEFFGSFLVAFPEPEPMPSASESESAPAVSDSESEPAAEPAETTPASEAPAASEGGEEAETVLLEPIEEAAAVEIVEVVRAEEAATEEVEAETAVQSRTVNRPLTQRPAVTASPSATSDASASSDAEKPEAEKDSVNLPVTGMPVDLKAQVRDIERVMLSALPEADASLNGSEAVVQPEEAVQPASSASHAAAFALAGAAGVGLIAAATIVGVLRARR